MEDLLAEAQEIFPCTLLAEDLGSVPVKRVRKSVGEANEPCYNE